jgi:DNA-binding CsgD family transcriptional regulator
MIKYLSERLNYCSIYTLLGVVFASISLQGQPQDGFVIHNFTKQEYNAESQNWSITRDRQGFIYAANNAGLLEFDGVDWSFYPSPNGTVIRSVAVDRNSRIYTSGYREIGYWERDPMGHMVYTSLNPKAESLFSQNEEFWNTVIIGELVYFHSFSSVFIYDKGTFRVIRAGSLITSISELDGRLCVHLAGKGLFMANDTLLEPFITDPEIRDDQVHFCLEIPGTGILIGTSSTGLFIFRENRLMPFAPGWTAYFKENKVNRGTLSGNGNIIIGTLLDGVVVFNRHGEMIHHINVTHGLQNNTILGIRSDEENNLWLALDQGIGFVSFRVDLSHTMYEADKIGAVYAASVFRGDLYLCTNQGVYYRGWENETEPFRIIPGTQGQAWSCGVYNDQLIVSHNEGTFRIENHQAERISPVSGGFNVTRDPDREDYLVQSTYSNIVFFSLVNQNWQYSYQLPGFNELIRYIELDHLNNIWASHMHRGIYRLKLNDTRDSVVNALYYGKEVFGKDYDIQVFKIENRIVFTTGLKIFTYSDLHDSIIDYQQLNRGLGRYAGSHRVVPAEDHHYWFISNTGTGLFRIYDNHVEKIREYPMRLFRDHLTSRYENIFPLSASEGLLCLDNGYAYLRADQGDLSDLIEDKKLSLKSITISGRRGNSEALPVASDHIEIPFNRNSLTLGFSFPFFSGEPQAFQSFIESLDASWSEPVRVPVFNFTRIPPGEYTIRARAFNEWNKNSIEEKIHLQVTPPWYLSKWGFVVYGVVVLLILVVGRYMLIRRIRARERKIKESKEKELIRLRNENLNAELSFKSQELATSTMAMIRKNEFLLELKETLRKQKEDLGTRYPDKYYSRLVKKIDNNIASMDDWNVFEIHFEKAHEDFLQKMVTKYPHLSHSDLRLCAYLRMNLSSKEIAPLLRISFRGVENHRYRLRKKLLLKKEVNLTDFILSI